VQPSPYDVWAAKEIIDLMNEAMVCCRVRSTNRSTRTT
jgi:hypothetical protein